MRAGYNYNKMREYSMTVGGLRNVYGGKAEVTLPTGYNMALEDMPPVGNVLPAGTPFGCDDFAKTAQPHYAFAVNAVVETTATQVQVKKDFEGTRARVGMVLMHLPNDVTDLDYTGTGVTVTAIDDSNADYDVLKQHLSKSFGVAVSFACNKDGKGKISFPFKNEEELERIIRIFDTLKQ